MCTLHQILLDYNDQMKEYEIGVACSTYGWEKKHIKHVGRKSWREETDHLGDIGEDGNIKMGNGETVWWCELDSSGSG
jgi:hypothetical protein